MSRFQAWLLHLSVGAITLTGGVYAWMRYAMETDDPFAVANHPWQPHALHLHVLAAPVVVFALGLVFTAHIWPKYELRVKARRWSGMGALWTIAPMVISGYLLQVLTNETALLAMKVTHWASSAVFVLAYVAHQLLRARSGITMPRDSQISPVAVPVRGDTQPSTLRRDR